MNPLRITISCIAIPFILLAGCVAEMPPGEELGEVDGVEEALSAGGCRDVPSSHTHNTTVPYCRKWDGRGWLYAQATPDAAGNWTCPPGFGLQGPPAAHDLCIIAGFLAPTPGACQGRCVDGGVFGPVFTSNAGPPPSCTATLTRACDDPPVPGREEEADADDAHVW